MIDTSSAIFGNGDTIIAPAWPCTPSGSFKAAPRRNLFQQFP